MPSFSSLTLAAAIPALAVASPVQPEKRAIAQTFQPPSSSPLVQSSNYTGANNGTLKNPKYKEGKAFDRIIHIWLENTDYDSAASTPAFQSLQETGQTLSNFYAVTHPSEPNYLASVYGDFFGLADDTFNHIPENTTSIFDLLDDKEISYACYQENMAYVGQTSINYTSPNYLAPNAPNYTYYQRKHNPCAMSDYISGNKDRALRNRNFNDLAADVKADALPQWNFITPNMVNDGHDTNPAFFSGFLDYFMPPLLAEPNFNSSKTLIVLTFDENEDYGSENRIMTIVMGGALPNEKRNTTEDLYMSHYSMISTVEANWGLKSLGRGDINKTMANVLPWVSEKVGLTGWNTQVKEEDRPETNLTGLFSGPLNPAMFIPFFAPSNPDFIGAGGQPVLLKDGVNKSLTYETIPASVNLTRMGQLDPYNTDPGFNNVALSTASGSNSDSHHDNSASSLLAHPIILGAGFLGVAFSLLL